MNKKNKGQKPTEQLEIVINRWYDRQISEVREDERVLNVLYSDFKLSGIPFTDIRTIDGILVSEVIAEAKERFNKQYQPPTIKDYQNKEFEKVESKFAPIADGICGLCQKYEDVRIETNSDGTVYFNSEDVDKRCKKSATYKFTPDEMEYLNVLNSVCDSLNKARNWEKKHGFRTFAGADTIDYAPDGGFSLKGFCTRLLADNKDVFSFTAEQFAILLAYGIIGKYGNDEKTL